MASPEVGVLSTTSELMSLHAFYGVIWGLSGLCVLVFIGRLWVRWISLRKLIAEDFIMIFVLCTLIASTIICQLRLHYIYMMEEVANGLRAPPTTFLEDVPKGLRALLAVNILSELGLWGVKFNFLLFFYRIFCSADPLYRRLWWAVVVVTILCFGAFVGLGSYKCVASDVQIILTECTEPPAIRLEWIQVQATSAIDAFNDVLIMIFPISILWRVRISLKKKLYLSLIFMMTLFTVAMAIIRGTISYGRIASDYTQSQNISWIWFWLYMELAVSILVACLVSFRSLFTQTRRAKPSYKPPVLSSDNPPTFGRSWMIGKKGKARWNMYDSLVDTCIELEGTSEVDSYELHDSDQTHIMPQSEGKTQGNTMSANHNSSELGWADSWIAWNRSDDRPKMVQNVDQAHLQV